MHTRPQTLREEIANAASHGLGLLLAAAALPVLWNLAAQRGTPATRAGVVVFAATMVAVYFASAVYHALPRGRAKDWFNRFDHAAIYLFIAGTFTPFAMLMQRGGEGWTPLALVWALALVGVAAKVCNRLRDPLRSTALYVALGWVAVGAALPLLQRLPAEGLLLIGGGGAAYTIGAVFFLLDHRLRYGHFVWHLFVLAGSTCHFFATLHYAAVCDLCRMGA